VSSAAPRALAETFPLIAHREPRSIVAWRRGRPVSAGRFMADVAAAAASLPDSGHVLNFCADRYRFAVLLCAAIVRGQVTLLPPTTTPNVIRSMRAFAPDAYYVSDDPAVAVDLPRHHLDAEGDGPLPAGYDVPHAPASQLVACVFTSGSTGEPQPNAKHWGPLVQNIRGEMRRLGVGPGYTILGTVPPQHMYGFESTIMLPLLSGATLTAERLYYPGDIDATITRMPAPRILFTTPFHLRAWLDSHGSEPAPAIETIVSATAPLSENLARRAERSTGCELLEIYGCTEAGQVATRRTSQGAEWLPFDGLRVWNHGEQAMVAGGHVEKPTPLADVIEVAADGQRFLLHGRTADLVNIAGKRNSIGYLNHQLTAIEGVEDAAFFLPEEAEADGVTRLVAFAVAPGMDAAQLLARLRERLDPVFLPRPLVLVDRLPRQITGKLPREALKALAKEHGIAAAARG
jgi:acyl-coenzyme A synthetase/AMP-(fatty) acid ligase